MTQAISDPKQASAALAELFETHSRVVFFGGAGVSTASGIPDFRSVDGLYHQRFSYPPETMLSHSFYETHPAEFFDFYRTKMIALGAKPNHCHAKLAELERAGKLDAVVTQNIDGLHQAAGSRHVFELHGSVHRNICQTCGAVYSAEWICAREHEDAAGVPVCLRAAVASSPMWSSTKNRSMSVCLPAPLLLSPHPTPSSWAGPRSWCIRRRASRVTLLAMRWPFAIWRPPIRMQMPTC